MEVLIKDIRNGMKNLNLTAIILEIGNVVQVKEREVRTVKVADATACINVSLWDEPGRYLVPGDIIRLTKAHASIFRSCLTLYVGKNSELDRVGDFCMVFNEQVNMSEPNLVLEGGPSIPLNNGGPGGGASGTNTSGSRSQGGTKIQQRTGQDQGKTLHKNSNSKSRGPTKGSVRAERR